VIEAATDEAGRKAPQSDLLDKRSVAAMTLPAARGDHHRGDQPE
jgi:hypothetical protein